MSDHVLGDGQIASWKNYHNTIAQAVPRVFVRQTPSKRPPLSLLGAIATDMANRMSQGSDIRPEGGGWSFSPLCATSGSMFERSGAGFDWPVAPEDVTDPLECRELRLVSGGRLIKDLNSSLADTDLSLATSGASNGQTIAGAIATGTHGSVPGWGGMQDHVIGMHLVGGRGCSHWVEAGRTLSDDAVAALGATRITDPGLMDACLVHLGGLGFVNAVLIRAQLVFRVGVVQRALTLTEADLESMARGEFRGIAQRMDFGMSSAEPYFFQVIFNPFEPLGDKALVRLLVKDPPAATGLTDDAPPEQAAAATDRALAALDEAGFGDLPDDYDRQLFEATIVDRLPDWAKTQWEVPPGLGPNLPGRKLVWFLVKALYRSTPRPKRIPAGVLWGEANGDHGYAMVAGRQFSTGIAFERQRLPEVVNCISEAVNAVQGGDVVMTVRFVARSRGSMALTRFPHNAVINLDGWRGERSRRTYEAAIVALEQAGIPFRQHPGKLSLHDAARFAREYADGIPAWREARARLLAPDVAPHFASLALKDWGLV